MNGQQRIGIQFGAVQRLKAGSTINARSRVRPVDLWDVASDTRKAVFMLPRLFGADLRRIIGMDSGSDIFKNN